MDDDEGGTAARSRGGPTDIIHNADSMMDADS